MSLEMTGSRLLAPAFGTSIYIWGALITVVMAALTLGYFLGGKAADRRPSRVAMALILGAAGLSVEFLPFWINPLCLWLRGLEPRAGSLLAAMAFFFLPSVLLAMVSPYGVKLASHSLANLGKTAGRLAALSSAGSIVGTLATSFFLIPAMGVRNIVHALGLVLLILAALSLSIRNLPTTEAPEQRQGPGPNPALLLIVCLASVLLTLASWRLAPANAGPHRPGMAKTLYARDTLYHHVIVDQYDRERHLHFDNSWQSAMDLEDPLRMVFAYTSYLHLAVVAHPMPRRMLCIGLGGGSVPSRFLHDYPSLQTVDVVEIDPEVAAVARRYFNLPADPRLRIFVQDGRLFADRMARAVASHRAEPYDIVIVDAYFAESIPYHLTTREFLVSLRRVLAPDGLVASNIIGAVAGPRSMLLRAMTRTFADVFPQVYLFPIWYGWNNWQELRNIILIATVSDVPWDGRTWSARARRLYEEQAIREDVPLFAQTLLEEPDFREPMRLRDAPLLTDDYAPVDTLQSPLGL